MSTEQITVNSRNELVLVEDVRQKYRGKFDSEVLRIIKVENSLNELILLEDGSMKFRGRFISAKEIPGGVLISFRDDKFGDLLNFDTSEFGPTPEDFERARRRGEPEETILDYHGQDLFIRDLLMHYHAYGQKGLGSFFTEGKEVKRQNLNMNIQEIAGKRLVPDYRSGKCKSWEAGAQDYAERYTWFGKEINPASLATTAKQIFSVEEKFGKKQ
jgi:hypothetical protein